MPTFRKGSEAIEEAVKSQGGGFTPFLPQLNWKDKDEKFILLLTPIEDTYTVDLHEFVEVGEFKKANGDTFVKKESFVSRKDRGIGEDYDKIEDLGREPRRRTLGVAVELEPTFETVRDRQRVSGFAVKTDTFTRKTDDGEVDVESPRVGMLNQAQKNFFGWLVSFDRTHAPAHETPLQVIRRGDGSDTTYDFIQVDQEIDFSDLFDNLDGIGYLTEEERDEVEKEIEAAKDDLEAATAVGVALLEKRFGELIDKERYDEFMDPIDKLPPPRFGGTAKKDDEKPSRGSRPARKSPRSKNGASSDEAESTDDSDKVAAFKELRDAVEADA
jgi:hypothetical protein